MMRGDIMANALASPELTAGSATPAGDPSAANPATADADNMYANNYKYTNFFIG